MKHSDGQRMLDVFDPGISKQGISDLSLDGLSVEDRGFTEPGMSRDLST
jgi:hypothetical protein